MTLGLRGLFLAAAILGMSGCANEVGTVVEPGSPVWMGSASVQQKAEYFGAVCARNGYEPGTPSKARCVAEETQSAEQKRQQWLAIEAAQPVSTQPRKGTCTTNRIARNMATANCI